MYVRRLDIFFQILLLKIASSYNLFLLRDELNIVFLIDISLGKLLQIVKEVKKKENNLSIFFEKYRSGSFQIINDRKAFLGGNNFVYILCEKKETRNWNGPYLASQK